MQSLMADAMHHVRVGKCSRRARFILKLDDPPRHRRLANETIEGDWPKLEDEYDQLITSIQDRKIRKTFAARALQTYTIDNIVQ